MKKIWILFALLLTMAMSMSLCVATFAAGENPDNTQEKGVSEAMRVSSENDGKYVEGFWRVENGIVRPITQAELNEIWSEEELDAISDGERSDETPASTWEDIYTFVDKKTVETKVYKHLSQPLSAWVEFGPEGGSFSSLRQVTFSRQYSITLTLPEIKSITNAISVGESVSTSTSVGLSTNPRPNSTARLRYAPECIKYTGTVEHRSWNYSLIDKKNVTVYDPTVHENGLYYIEYQ